VSGAAALERGHQLGHNRRMQRSCLILAIVLAVLIVPDARAQTPPGSPPSAAPQPAEAGAAAEAPVVIFNRTITVFRAPMFGISPENRADRTERIVSGLLSRGGEGVVTTQAQPQGNFILIDGELAIIIMDADADRIRGETLALATERAVATLQLVISETRESRDHALLLRELLNTVIGTGVLIGFIALVLVLRRALSRRLGRLAERAAAVTRVGGTQVVTTDRLLPVVDRLVSVVAWVVIVLSVYRWISYVLSQFPYTRPWGESLRTFFVDTGVDLIQGAVGALPGLAVAIFILLMARVVIGMVTPFFDRVGRGYSAFNWLDRDTAQPTKRLFALGVWLFALAMAYPYLPGSQSQAFQGISVLLGLMVTFGGSSLFGQGASGLILMYSRTLRVGEYVRVDDHEGTVTELGSFTTRVRTGLGEELTLPNSLVLGTVVKNYSRAVKGKGYIVDTTVTIGYDTPWRQVEAMLIEAARRTTGILDDPTPRVFQTALSDFYPEYRLVCQAIPREPRPRAEVLATLHENIQDVFNEYGVQIMSPHYLGDPHDAKLVPKEKWHTAPAKPD
jgi:small-conductance mechanosensitive channel